MALVFIDGFDHYEDADFDDKYFLSNVAQQDTTEPRTGIGCCKFVGSSGNFIVQVPAKDTYIVGFGIKLSGITFFDQEDLISFYEDSSASETQVSVIYTGDKRFQVLRGQTLGGTVLATTTDQFDLYDGWHYLEFKAFINNTTGSFELRFDEENILSATNVDTRNNNAEADEIKHIHIQRIEVVNTSTFFDDLYICDTTGTKNKDFLGDCQVTTIFPKADGALEDFTRSVGADSFALVNDNPPDDDSTHVESNTVGHKDSFDMDDVSSMTTILGVQLTEYARFLTGSADIKHLARIDGGNFLGSTKTLAGSYDFHMFIWEDNPDLSSAWTINGINTAEFGMEVV